MRMRAEQLAMAVCVVATVLSVAGTAFAGGSAIGTGSLDEIKLWIGEAGPTVAIIGMGAGGLGLMFGRDFGQLAQVGAYVALVAALMSGASSIIAEGGLLP